MLSKGTILGHYRLLERVGAGGMGEVYVAEDTRRVERRVAIKVVRAEPQQYPDSAASQEASRLFQREMEAIILLDHPNILPMIDFGEQMLENIQLTYMVMPYRKEGSLKDWLQRPGLYEKLSPDDIDHLITQAADALQHAHDRHIVHQDIKPSNFLIREHPNRPLRPDLLLTDFGLAKLTNTMTTDSQQVRGTPTFMPPEQWRGKPVPATDQYALAILAYQLMAGSPPFTGGMEQAMYQHLTDSPTPPSTHVPSISPEIDAVILRALAKKPEERFPSINDFAAALHIAILSREKLQPMLRADNRPSEAATPPTTVVPPPSLLSSRDLPPPPVSSPVPVKLPPPKRVFKVSPAAILVIALVVVLSVGTTLAYFSPRLWPSHKPTSTPTTVAKITATPSPTATPTSVATPTSIVTPTSVVVVPASALIVPGILTVGVSDNGYDSPPETYYPSGSSSPAGFDIDLITAIAQAMKLKTNIKQIPLNSLVNGLKNKQIDVVIEGYTLTDQIKNQTLSVPYLAPKDVLLVPTGNPGHLNFNGLTDLCGHTIGVESGTSELDDLKTANQACQQGHIQIVTLPKADDVANALIQKQQNIEAIYQSTTTVSYYQHQYPGKFQQVGTTLPIPEEGILIRQDNYALLTPMQNTFNSLVQDGTYKKLLNTPMGDMTGDSIVSN